MGSHGSRQPGRKREGWKVGVVGVRERKMGPLPCVSTRMCVFWFGMEK